MRRLALYALTSLSLTLCAPCLAQDAPLDPAVDAFLKAWEATNQGLTSLRVEFTQTKRLRILRRPLISKGVTLMKGGRVLMVVLGRDGKRETEVLVDAEAVRMHYPKLKKVEVYPKSAGGPRAPFVIFGEDVASLPTTHGLTLEKDGDVDVLIMIPKDPKSTEKETRLRFREHVIVGMTQVSTKGDAVELDVTTFEKNAVVEDEELVLTTTEATRVVEVAPNR